MENDKLRSIIEALLFVANEPLKLEQIANVLEVDENRVKEQIDLLISEYRARNGGINIIEIAGGYQMGTNPEYAEWLTRFYTREVPTKLSQSARETLAIIAYRQPITRAGIESIRGVNSDSVVNSLLEKGLITISGRKKGAGRPLLYSTTDKFLHHFGLKDLSDLPSVEEIEEMFGEREEIE